MGGLMTPSKQCKALTGLSLKQISEAVNRPVRTLQDWHANQPLFIALCKGGRHEHDRQQKMSLVDTLVQSEELDEVKSLHGCESVEDIIDEECGSWLAKLIYSSLDEYGQSEARVEAFGNYTGDLFDGSDPSDVLTGYLIKGYEEQIDKAFRVLRSMERDRLNG